MSKETRPYRDRAEVNAMQDGRVFGGLYKDTGGFGVFGGGIDPGEKPVDAATREFNEETGRTVKNVRQLPIPPLTIEWLPPYSTPKLVERAKKFRGSRTFFTVGELVKGKADSVDPEEKPNLSKVRLYDLSEAIRLATPKTDNKELERANAKRKEVLEKIKQEAHVQNKSDFASGFLTYCQEQGLNGPQIKQAVERASQLDPDIREELSKLGADGSDADETAKWVGRQALTGAGTVSGGSAGTLSGLAAGLLAGKAIAGQGPLRPYTAGFLSGPQLVHGKRVPIPLKVPQFSRPGVLLGLGGGTLGALAGGYAGNQLGSLAGNAAFAAKKPADGTAKAAAESDPQARPQGRLQKAVASIDPTINAGIRHGVKAVDSTLTGLARKGLQTVGTGAGATLGLLAGQRLGGSIGYDLGAATGNLFFGKQSADNQETADPQRSWLGFLGKRLAGTGTGLLANSAVDAFSRSPRSLVSYGRVHGVGDMVGASAAAGFGRWVGGGNSNQIARDAAREVIATGGLHLGGYQGMSLGGAAGNRVGQAVARRLPPEDTFGRTMIPLRGRQAGGLVGGHMGAGMGYSAGHRLVDALAPEQRNKQAAVPLIGAAGAALSTAGRAALPYLAGAGRWLWSGASRMVGAGAKPHGPANPFAAMAQSSTKAPSMFSNIGSHVLPTAMFVGAPMAMEMASSRSAPAIPSLEKFAAGLLDPDYDANAALLAAREARRTGPLPAGAIAPAPEMPPVAKLVTPPKQPAPKSGKDYPTSTPVTPPPGRSGGPPPSKRPAAGSPEGGGPAVVPGNTGLGGPVPAAPGWRPSRNMVLGGLGGLAALGAGTYAYNRYRDQSTQDKKAFLEDVQKHWQSLDPQHKIMAGLGGTVALGALFNRLHSGESSTANTAAGLGGLGVAAYGLTGGQPVNAIQGLLGQALPSQGQNGKNKFFNPDGSPRIHDIIKAPDAELRSAVSALPGNRRQALQAQLSSFQPTTFQRLAAGASGVDIEAQRNRLAGILR